MTEQFDQIQKANDAAARAALAWLLAAGIAAEIDALRFPDGFSPVPAPGLTAFVADAERGSADAALAADRVAALTMDRDTTDAVATAAADSLAAADAAELATRRLAQLAFGISAHLIGDDRVERLDRAAVAILFPPAVDRPRSRLADDATELRAKVRPELVVEIAGGLCRILVERNSCLRLTGQGGAVVEVSVDGGSTLCVLTNVEPGDLDGDWGPFPGERWIACWPSPVTIREPAEVIASLLLPQGAMSECEVKVDAAWRAEVADRTLSILRDGRPLDRNPRLVVSSCRRRQTKATA